MLNVLKKLGLVVLLCSPAALYLYIVSDQPSAESPAAQTTTTPTTPDH